MLQILSLNTTMRNLVFPLLLLVALLSACSSREKKAAFVVGVSQCSDDAWRTKMNQEMNQEMVFHPDLELRIRQAQDNSVLQCQQIDSFIREGVDILIVSPNEAEEVKPAVTRAYEAGIPVVVADRRVSGDKWTAFIGGDNLEVGHLMGEWLIGLLESGQLEEVRMLEIGGLPGSTPAVWRHKGMTDRIAGHPHIHTVAQGIGRWFWADAKAVTDSLLQLYPDVNVIVAQNDQMAQGASEAAAARGVAPLIMGVDAITGPGGGIEAILDGRMQVAATYSSRGDIVLRTASQILHNQPYLRDTVLPTVMVDRNSALPMKLQAQAMEQNYDAIKMLQGKMLIMGDQYKMQRLIIYSLAAVIVLCFVLLAVVGGIFNYRARVKAERARQNEMLARQKHQLEEITAELARAKAQQSDEGRFVKQLEREVEAHLSDPDLDVEQLAGKLGMSRTGLYRKVKAATGQSPVELIRHIRLHKAQQMLQHTDATVQQVAYEVGFSAPSYFAKCYKEEFGISPNEELKEK